MKKTRHKYKKETWKAGRKPAGGLHIWRAWKTNKTWWNKRGEKLQIGSNPCPFINHQHLPELGFFQLDGLNLKHDPTAAKHGWFMAYTQCLHPKNMIFRLIAQAILTGGWDFEAIQHLLNLGCFFGSRGILKKSELLRPQGPQEIWRELKASEGIWWPWGSSPLWVLNDWVRDMVHDLLFFVHMTIKCEAYPWLNNHGWWVNPIKSNGKRFVNM